MVEHHRDRQTLQHVLQLDDLLALGDELDMPAEIGDLAGDRFEIGDRSAARKPRPEAHAADAGRVEAAQLVGVTPASSIATPRALGPKAFSDSTSNRLSVP